MKYLIKRFSSPSPYSKDYENKTSGEFLEDIDSARKGKEIQALDEEANRIRWRSSLDKYESREGTTPAVMGGPGGIAGKWVGDKTADILDKAGKSDDDIKNVSNSVGVIAGIGAGLGSGYVIKRGVGDSADKVIKKAAEELSHFENYKKDVPAYSKMSRSEKALINQEISKRNNLIKSASKRSAVGKYAMPVLGIVGALGAAKAVNDSVSERLARRKAIDSENRSKKETIDKWNDFKHKASDGIKETGRLVKRVIKKASSKNKNRKPDED